MRVDPQANPALAQTLANQAMAPEPEAPLIPPRPPKDVFELPAGWVDNTGTLHKDVRVREMNGYDEEELARPSIKSVIDFIDLIIKRCTVDIGGERPEARIMDDLLIGDRDAVLIAVRVATFGNEFSMPVVCREVDCGEQYEVKVDIAKDIDVKELPGDPTQRMRPCILADGREVQVRLMTGAAQRAAYGNDFNDAQQASIMLLECIYSIGGEPVHSIDQIKKLGTNERRQIIKFLDENTCGPQWQGVMHPCPNCQVEAALPINLVALFRD